MGVDVRLETADGEAVETVLDFDGLFERFLAEHRLDNGHCLRFVDPFGNTAFNQLQVPFLVAELACAIDGEGDPAVKSRTEAILALAQRCQGEFQTQIKFYGG